MLEKDGSVANEKGFTVPTGVSAFDAASWNGIAIDSTCGGYGTCKKCRIKVTTGVPQTKLDLLVRKKKEQSFRPQTTKAISGKVEKLKAEIAKIYAEG